MKTSFDAVVIGAGPAGASTALLLARAGWRVALVERQRFPRRKVCGECIAASNLPLLEALGVGDAFARQAGHELRRVALLRERETVVAPLPAAAPPSPRYGRALGREHLDTLLADQAEAAGATRFQPWSLQSIEGSAGRFRLRLQSIGATGVAAEACELHAGLVVAAHGSWEPLPSERPASRRVRRSSDLFAFKANFRNASIAADLLPVLAFRGGYGGMVIADDGVATLACCVREDRLALARDQRRGERAGDAVETMLRLECAGVAEALAAASREGAWLASGPIRPGVRLGAGDGVFRVGNAAGEAHPIVGEGISMALQSAFMLAALLDPARMSLLGPQTAASAQRHAMASYESLWRQRFSTRLRIAATFAHVAMRPALSRPFWPLVRRWPGALTLGARWSGKTSCAPEAARLAATVRSALA